MRKRNKTRKVKVGGIYIGGDSPVSIQSMTNIPIEDIDGTINQIFKLGMISCEKEIKPEK